MKATYPPNLELLLHNDEEEYKNLEYRFIVLYEAETTAQELSIDSYFNTLRIMYKNNPKNDQTKWLLSWWNVHKTEFPNMAQAVRDHLAVPASEVNVERLLNAGRDNTLGMMVLLKDASRMQSSTQK